MGRSISWPWRPPWPRVASKATHHLCGKKKKKNLKFTSINDAVEVDVDLVHESEREKSSRAMKMENKSLKFIVIV